MVAPLSNRDALLGMPFFAKEGILVDPANRSLILPEMLIEPPLTTSATDVALQPTETLQDIGNSARSTPTTLQEHESGPKLPDCFPPTLKPPKGYA